jgi:TRAP transporter TAXI family solute receptor
MQAKARPVAAIVWLALQLVLAAVTPPTEARAGEEIRYLRVGTASPGETHFQLGNLLASAISAPPGLPPCARGGSCGVPGLIAGASATSGSIANIEAIADGRLDAGLTQADIPFWAATGAPPFQGRPITNLRAIANIGADQMHLVVWRDGPIRALRDLRGRRLSLGETGSGTLVHARQLLAALGIKESDVKIEHMRSAVAADAMLDGKIDAFFVMDSAPVPTVAELAKTRPIRLIGIAGPAAEKLKRADPLLVPSRIAANLYDGVDSDTITLTGLTTTTAYVKAKTSRLVTARTRLLCACKQFTDWGKDPRIGCRVRARCTANWALIDIDDFIEVL